MKCPHCTISVHVNLAPTNIRADNQHGTLIGYQVSSAACPHCYETIIFLQIGPAVQVPNTNFRMEAIATKTMVWPQGASRPCSPEVPKTLASDFSEAVSVLPISPQASAALTRRCLQEVLRDYGGTTAKDLVAQIQQVIDQGHISASLAEQLDAVRHIGNFAAH